MQDGGDPKEKVCRSSRTRPRKRRGHRLELPPSTKVCARRGNLRQRKRRERNIAGVGVLPECYVAVKSLFLTQTTTSNEKRSM